MGKRITVFRAGVKCVFLHVEVISGSSRSRRMDWFTCMYKIICSLLMCLFYLTVAFTAHPIEDFVWQYNVIPTRGTLPKSSTLPRRLASDRAGKIASTSLDLRSVVASRRWKWYRRCRPLAL
jgi:hypothetical protein